MMTTTHVVFTELHMAADIFEILRRFDELPDDALVSGKIAAIVLGVSERTLRRHPPTLPVQVSPQVRNFRVGSIRAMVRGIALSA
jgi:hypothetical protein